MRRAPAGFTLIEVLIVLVIFGIAAAAISLRLLPDDARRARQEAEATALLIEQAAAEAESTGRPLAWLPETTQSRFERPDGQGGWAGVSDDPDFAPRALSGGLRWGPLAFRLPGVAAAATASVMGAPVADGSPSSGARSPQADARPRLVFLPGQTSTEFDIVLGTATGAALLHGDSLGHVRVETRQ